MQIVHFSPYENILLWALFIVGLGIFWQLLRIRHGLNKTLQSLGKPGQTK